LNIISELISFWSVIAEDSTSLIVKAMVENKKGEVADGCGAMPIMDKWAFLDPSVSHEKKLEAMKETG